MIVRLPNELFDFFKIPIAASSPQLISFFAKSQHSKDPVHFLWFQHHFQPDLMPFPYLLISARAQWRNLLINF